MTFRPLQDTQQMLGSLQDELNRVFDRVWHVGLSTAPLNGQDWAPAVDVYEYDDRYVIVAEAPGIDADQIELSQLGETLTIRGEKKKPSVAADSIATLRNECRHGRFYRTVDLPPGADMNRITARCNSGLLEITVPKSESTKPRTIHVKGETDTACAG